MTPSQLLNKRFYILRHLTDCFVIYKISRCKLDSEFCLNVRHHTHCIKGAHAEIKLKIVFSLDFVSFHVVFKDSDKLFE